MEDSKYEPIEDDVTEELPNTQIQKIEDYIPVLIIRDKPNKKRSPKEVIYITKSQQIYMESLWQNNNTEMAALEAGVSIQEAEEWFRASPKLREYYRQLQIERAMARRMTQEYLDSELIKIINKNGVSDKDRLTAIRTGYMKLGGKKGNIQFNFVESNEEKAKNITEAETE